MIFVFFIYGLTFFILGLAIFVYPKKDSTFKLANNLWLIAIFGIVHGINEWVDMFILINKPIEIAFLKIVGLLLLAVSFLFLVQFGVRTITETKKKYSAIKASSILLFIAWIAVTILSSQRLLSGKIWARYILGIPGICITAHALFLQIPEFKKRNLTSGIKNLKLAAVAFLFYGFFSGLIVSKAEFFPASIFNYMTFSDILGIPVQVFRSVCAVIIAYAMIRVLGVFGLEAKTRIKNLLEETQKAKEFTGNILNTMRDGLDIVSQDCTIQFANKTFLDIFGKGIIGKKCYEVYKINKKQCDECPVKGQVKTGETFTFEVSGIVGGKTFLVSHTGIKNPDGSFAILEIFRDIAELKQLEKMKDSLTQMIVHDLNNPLMILSGNIELLEMDLQDILSDHQKERLHSTLNKSHEAIDMISNLLDISKMEEGKLKLKYEEIDLNALIKEVVDSMDILARQDEKKLSSKIAPDIPRLLADRELLKRIISNLIGNALKFTPSRYSIETEADYNKEDKEVILSIRDHGQGIPEEYQGRIFDKFAQVEPNQSKGRTGKGLGLTFCKMAIEAHGGKIWVKSKFGEGSTFYFTIPVKE